MHSPTPMQPHPGTPPFPEPEMPMPGTVKTARALLFTIGGLNAVAGLLLLIAGAAAAIALGGILVANCLRRDAAAYFNRPRIRPRRAWLTHSSRKRHQ
ncbi:hypothetical protein ACQB60_31615 [Actinomycetota bacterium Odt1-20B]